MTGCIGRSGASYLVQARGHGEPWKTINVCPTRDQAEGLADVLATWTFHNGCSQYPYVRVTFRGSVVYDPRHTPTTYGANAARATRKSLAS